MKFRPNFLKRTKDVFLVCEKFRENAALGAVLPLFYFVCKLSAKRKNPKGTLRFFVLAGFFIFKFIFLRLFCGILFVYRRGGIEGVISPKHICQLDQCLFFLCQLSLQSFLNMQKQ